MLVFILIFPFTTGNGMPLFKKVTMEAERQEEHMDVPMHGK